MNVPILSSKFFEKYTPDLGFFTKWRSMYHWNDQIMPIYEWQDVLYIGCASLPATLPKTQQKLVFLLCDPEELKRVWYNFEGTVVVSRSQSTQASAKIKPHIPEPTFHPEPVLKFELEESPAPQSLDAIIAEENPEAVAPLDLNQDLPIEKLEVNSPPAISEELELPELTLTYQSPNSINLGTTETVQEISSPAAKVQENVADQEVTVEVKFDAASTAEISEPAVIAPAVEQKVKPSASPQSVSADPMEALMALHGGGGSEESAAPTLEASGESSEGEAKPSEEAEEGLELLDLGGSAPAPSLQATSPAQEGSLKLEPLTAAVAAETPATPALTATSPAAKENTITPSTPSSEKNAPVTKSQLKSPPLEAWAEKAISEVKLEFEKVMILLRTGDQVKPWRWDEDFKSASPTLAPFSLIPASPFRIVNRTHKSYHGYVVTNDFNQKFFAQWNNNDVPEHMTIAPIVNQDVVVGMILAIGKKSADTKGCLQLVEDKAATLASHITATPSAA